MNYYQILKVSKNASNEEIRESYISLIKKYHPDIYEGNKEFAEKTTKELNDAYDVLSDPQKRTEYDLSITESQYTSTNVNSYTNTTNNYYSKNNSTTQQSTQKFPKGIIELLVEKFFKFIEKRTDSWLKNSKHSLIIIVLLFALILALISIIDFIKLSNLR